MGNLSILVDRLSEYRIIDLREEEEEERGGGGGGGGDFE